MQTSVPYNIAAAIAGAKADLNHGYTRSYVNAEASAEIPFGVVVKEGTNDGEAKLITTAADKLAGLVLFNQAYDVRFELGTTGVKPKVMLSLMQRGIAWVAVEEAVSCYDVPWVRFAASLSNPALTQTGSFRKSADGAAAEKHTVTPTAVDSTLYVLRVEVNGKSFTFEFLSGVGTSATLICNGFRTLMQANAEFNALVLSTGTATLILTATGLAIGQSFQVQNVGDGVLTDVLTTPEAATAIELAGCRYLTSQSVAGGLAQVEVDFNAVRAAVRIGQTA